MPETPGTEGRRGPPPVPGAERAPQDGSTVEGTGASLAAGTNSMQMSMPSPMPSPLTGEHRPGDVSPIDELVALIGREVEATSDPDRKADLQTRLALIFWDLL